MKKYMDATGLMRTVIVFLFWNSAFAVTGSRVESEHLETEVLAYGIYDVIRGDKVKEDETAAGYRSEPVEWKLVRQTDRIPVKLGTTFGVKYKILGENIGEMVTVDIVTRFPQGGIENPETGKIWIADRYQSQGKVGSGLFFGFRLSKPWEMVPGEWSLEVHYQGEAIGVKRFNLVAE